MSYKPYYTGGWQSGESGGTPLTPEALQHFDNGIISAHRAGQPKNLLDNSNFLEPVNQRGLANYVGRIYGIDRWKGDSNETVLTIVDGGITATGGYLNQLLENPAKFVGKVLTFAVCNSEGCLTLASGTIPPPTSGKWLFGNNDGKTDIGLYQYSDGRLCISFKQLDSNSPIMWTALYEGVYTFDTLPHYQSKKYHEELSACQRYAIVWNSHCRIPCTLCNPTTIDFILPIPQTMRTIPSINVPMYVTDINGTVQTDFAVSVKNGSNEPGYVSFRATKPSHGLTSALLEVHEKAILSADL